MRLLLLIFFLLILGSSEIQAQPPCDCGDGTFSVDCCPPGDPGAPVPITGIEILIGAGVLLGAKRILSKRKVNT